MQLGAFSISLAVKDIAASQSFYEKLGFKAFGGKAADNWLILKHGDHLSLEPGPCRATAVQLISIMK